MPTSADSCLAATTNSSLGLRGRFITRATVKLAAALYLCFAMGSHAGAQSSIPQGSIVLAQWQADSCAFASNLKPPTPPTRQLVAVSYKVSADGQLREATVTGQSGDADFDARLTALLRECRFVPGRAPDSQGVTFGVMFMALGPWPVSSEPVSGAKRKPGALAVPSCGPQAMDYPAASVRAMERGSAAMRFWVHPDGRLNFIELTGSTGFPRLDHASILVLTRCKLHAGVDEDGKPQGGSFDIGMTWKIE